MPLLNSPDTCQLPRCIPYHNSLPFLNKPVLVTKGNYLINSNRWVGQMAALYSRPFLIFMATSAPMPKARATANIAGYAIGTGFAALKRSPAIMPIIKELNPITSPEIQSIQTSIDARALNICGIFPPPVNSVVKVYTRIASCQGK